LAINPFIETVRDDLKKYLPEYRGKLFVVTGENDKVIGKDTVAYIQEYARNVSDLQTYIVPNCDHQFKGEDNAKILSQLPRYYFLEEYKVKSFLSFMKLTKNNFIEIT
jgi:pimeloyl-ACP methyl ester carboxylesterase